MTRDAATEAQVRAAQPDSSVWLSANAGSGKTRVLTDRVARLLFDDVPPGHILCLTYTKAAASEMQNRLFDRLGSWAMLPDDPLRAELERLGIEGPLPEARLAHARRLFALAIETPGGLRIQTIHSFCASLLRRFPVEAGVSPQFTEIEDRAADLLRADILEAMSSGEDADRVASVARYFTDADLVALCRDISGNRDAFVQIPKRDDLCAIYKIDPGLTEAGIANTEISGDLPFLAEIEPIFASGSSNDQKVSVKLKHLPRASLEAQRALERIFLTGETAKEPFSAKIGSIPTKALANGGMAPHMPRLEALMRRIEEARHQRIAISAVNRDHALYQFAERYLSLYEREKQLRGWLDFDDLIDRTRALLTNDAVAEWVLYRLDGGIDHILVDEAQDTSPRQWQVIERLAHELKSGQGARDDIRRTIFVVGDKKQSIYSFQGADPGEFDRMCVDFEAGLKDTSVPFFRQSLAYSFRSSEPILRVVDNTFTGREDAGFSADQNHIAFKDQMPGRVDLWPLVEKTKDDAVPEDDWYKPVDRPSSQHHDVLLAKRIARFIKNTVDGKAPIPHEIGHSGAFHGRAARPGDFLILVRRRSRLFTEVIRACKQAGLPIAGADRLKVTAELAVRDLGALLAFVATPEDSHSLAVALRSPLLGLDEQALFDLAHRRDGPFLWSNLRAKRAEFGSVLKVLDDLLDQADFLRPYDLIERILIRHDGRRKLLGRLGEEAQDGIDALLSQALSYEQTEVPSLTGFLQWMTTDDLEIKRQMDAAGDRVRIMTVHGAKGLEAPVVILPDCGKHTPRDRDSVVSDENGAFWKMPKDERPPRQVAAVETAAETRQKEDDRLLYVAMTRAEKWLVVAAAGDLGKKGDTWYERAHAAISGSGGVEHQFEFGGDDSAGGLRLQNDQWPTVSIDTPTDDQPPDVQVPEHLTQEPPQPTTAPETLTPSDLGGAKALPGPDNSDEDAAKRWGSLVHQLLELLPAIPPDERESMARDLLRVSDLDATQAETDALVSEVTTVLNNPDLAWIFDVGAHAEVSLTAPISTLNGRTFFGVIDRLIIGDTRVIAVDFKSNQTVPETPDACPEGLLRQMGAYAAMLAAIYPDKSIETGILWTRTAQFMPLDHDHISQALSRVSLP